MNGQHNNRTYAVIPIEKVPLYVKSPAAQGRLSVDGRFLIWDEAWNPITLAHMKQDQDVKLLTHKQALELMSTEQWRVPTEPGS